MKIKKHHFKKVIHPNRWFIWAVVLILISGFSLLAFIKWSSLHIDSDSAFAELRPKKIYTDASGYTVRYPNSWIIEKDSSGNTVFENPDNNSESLTITVTTLGTESIIRHSLAITYEKDIAKDNLQIALIKAKDSNDGSSIDAAIITSEKKLYYISGHSSMLESFARNFKAE